MTSGTSTNNSDMVSIRVSRATQEMLKKGNMTYDDVISSLTSPEEMWDVQKIDADMDKIEKSSKYYSSEEVFKGL